MAYYRHRRALSSGKPKTYSKTKLSEDQENILLGYVLSLSKAGVFVSRAMTIHLVETLFHVSATKTWFSPLLLLSPSSNSNYKQVLWLLGKTQ